MGVMRSTRYLDCTVRAVVSCFLFVHCISILEGDGGKKGGTEMQTVVGTTEQSVRRVAFTKGLAVKQLRGIDGSKGQRWCTGETRVFCY